VRGHHVRVSARAERASPGQRPASRVRTREVLRTADNLIGHHFCVGAEGRLEGLDDRCDFGRRPNATYIPRYRNLFGEKRPYLRGFRYEGSASRTGWARAVAELGIGGDFKDEAAEPGPWRIGGTTCGEMSPITGTSSRSTRRERTGGGWRCSRSIAHGARTSTACAGT